MKLNAPANKKNKPATVSRSTDTLAKSAKTTKQYSGAAMAKQYEQPAKKQRNARITAPLMTKGFD
jgi:hypothetical protein